MNNIAKFVTLREPELTSPHSLLGYLIELGFDKKEALLIICVD